MPSLDQEELQQFVSDNVVVPFYTARLSRLESLSLADILKRKNPYLFKAKNIQTAEELVKYILDAFLSSEEETIFGNLMEELAIFVCKKTFNGYKAEQGRFKSVDLIFTRDDKTYIVGIKSGTAWGNKDQVDRMKTNFKNARRIMKQDGVRTKLVSVNGCIYGRDKHPHKVNSHDREKSYYKLCGQEFWELISGDSSFYKKVIVPIDKEAKKRDESFKSSYSEKINKMTKEFSDTYVLENGQINWDKIIDFVSKKAN